MVFQIHQLLASSWSLAHTVCSLSNTPTLLDVLHIAEISMTSAALSQFVAQFPATKNGDDPSGISMRIRFGPLMEEEPFLKFYYYCYSDSLFAAMMLMFLEQSCIKL
jgi:hypothetical protein